MDEAASSSSSSQRQQQRLLAVAKLKRAASLPRMKDGRRPPMHPEGFSEGERGGSTGENSESSTPPLQEGEGPQQTAQEPVTEHVAEKEVPEQEPELERPMDETDMTTPTKQGRRRSRSRPRSRGSKDLKGKARQTPPPTSSSPSPMLPAGDSSQDEGSSVFASSSLPLSHSHSPSPGPFQQYPRLARSPTPNAFLRSPTPNGILRSPTPNSQDPNWYPPYSASPVPSLQAIQQTLLQRSNSGGRNLAMHKLTGGKDVYDMPPVTSNVRRNNTVSGGERNVVRNRMLVTLQRSASRNATRELDAEQSAGEDPASSAPSPSPTPTGKRRRRHRRRSSNASNPNKEGVSDSDFPPTTPNTPNIPPTPLPTGIIDISLAPLRTPSAVPSRILSPSPGPAPIPVEAKPSHESFERSPSVLDRHRSAASQDHATHPFENPVVEEEEDDDDERTRNSPSAAQENSASNGNGRSEQRAATPSEVPKHLGNGDSAASSPRLRLMTHIVGHTDSLPSSPFQVPLKEEEQSPEVRQRTQSPLAGHRRRERERSWISANRISIEREISWDASPVPEMNMKLFDEDGDADVDADVDADTETATNEVEVQDNEDEPSSPRSRHSSAYSSRRDSNNPSPRDSDSQQVVVEIDASSISTPSFAVPASPSSVAGVLNAQSVSRDSGLSQLFSSRISAAEQIEIEDRSNPLQEGPSKMRSGESIFEKVKSSLRRSNSRTGRRSRTNSIRRDSMRRDPTDSSASRESGTSITKSDSQFAMTQMSPMLHSASGSRASLSPTGQDMGSHIPPPTNDRYHDAKLFPFPGLASASTPDIINSFTSLQQGQQSHSAFGRQGTNGQMNSRGLGHKASESALDKYGMSPSSSGTSDDYFGISPSASSTITKLPMSLSGAKQWLKNKGTSQTSSGTTSATASPGAPPQASKMPSLTSMFRNFGADFDDLNGGPTVGGKKISSPQVIEVQREVYISHASDIEGTPRARRVRSPTLSNDSAMSPIPYSATSRSSFPSPPDPTSTTPDPISSMSDIADSSSLSSQSDYAERAPVRPPQGPYVLERLEENLSRSSRSPMWAAAMEVPPRKLLLASPVGQIVNANTVKDRFLFLFSDLLVIAKPVTDGEEDLTGRINLDTKEFVVKNIVMLRDVKCSSERSDNQSRVSANRNPLIRSFVHAFARNPDEAVSALLIKSGIAHDASVLGKLLFRTLELDRARLGEYLSARTSKVVLKNYLDCFGFTGLRIDRALRAFLMSIRIPSDSALDSLLDAFSSRWYEANASMIAFDRNLTMRLVRLLVQLNDRLNGGIADEPGRSTQPRQNLRREFVKFFRTWDPRNLVPEELLEDVYLSVVMEGLYQSRAPTVTEVPITIKRAPPTRLTYKTMSEPVVLRIPQADPHLSIQLYGQDLIFEPPVLTFQKSPEASFRIMGTSLGVKTMMMCRSSPNSIKYSPLPLSNTIAIEREFMRNTFQIAFNNSMGLKRLYMFSLSDTVVCSTWVSSLKMHIEKATTSSAFAVDDPTSPTQSRLYRAVELMSFQALEQTLLGSESSSPTATLGNGIMFHSRSKSRSRLYGKAEEEAEQSPSPGEETPPSASPHWSRRQLEQQCLQNSSIPLILSYLQVGAPQHGQLQS